MVDSVNIRLPVSWTSLYSAAFLASPHLLDLRDRTILLLGGIITDRFFQQALVPGIACSYSTTQLSWWVGYLARLVVLYAYRTRALLELRRKHHYERKIIMQIPSGTLLFLSPTYVYADDHPCLINIALPHAQRGVSYLSRSHVFMMLVKLTAK
jgi:hypothetical protein